MLRPAVAVALLTVALALPLAAQMTEVQPGARVRVQAPGVVAGTYVGTVLRRTADTVVLGGPNVVPLSVPFASITSLEISRGKSRTDGAIVGMKWGVPILAASGGALAYAATTSDNCRTCEPVNSGDVVGFIALSAMAGAFYGAGIGAIVGRERWDSFDLTRRTSLHLDRGRVGLEFGF